MTAMRVDLEVVGRSAELATIGDFLAGTGGRAVVLEGEPGIGKTTVWGAAVEDARSRRYAVLEARPARVEASLSLAGLADLFAGLDPAALAGLPDVQARAVAAALGDEEPAAHGAQALGAAVLGVVRGLAGGRQVLVAIDDLQWLDQATAALVIYMFRRLRGEDVRLLASVRGEPGSPLPYGLERVLGDDALVRLAIGPLSEGAIRRLVRLRLATSLSRFEAHLIHEATGGNPFYALEVCRAGFEIDASGVLHLPRRTDELAGARLRELPASAYDALLIVAALSEAREDVLVRLGVWDALRPALDAGVLEFEHGSVRFAHALIAAAAWGDASDERRREVHRILAGAVDDPEQRARHLAAATDGPDKRVSGLLEDAAARARRRGAPAAAAELLDRALELTPTGELDVWARLAAASASAHAEAGQYDRVSELVEESLERLPPGPARAAIVVAKADVPGFGPLLRRTVAEAGTTPVGVRATIGLSEQAGLMGHWDEAISTAARAATLARDLGDRGLLGVALTWLGGLKLFASQLDGRGDIAEALAIERELGALPTTVFQSPRTWEAMGLIFADDPIAASALLRERLDTALERGDDTSSFQAMRLLTQAQFRAGDWETARRTGADALDLIETLGYDYGRPVLLGALAELAAGEGDLDGARDLGSEAVAGLAGFGDRFWATPALAALVLTELCAGDPAAALGHCETIAGFFPGHESWWSHHQGDEIEALIAAGDHATALRRAAEVRTAGEELGVPRLVAWAARGAGLVREAEDDLDGAEAALAAAAAAHDEFFSPFERARTLLAYGRVLRRRLRRRAARDVLGEALTEFERLGAAWFAEAARSEMSHVGGRPPTGEHELTAAEERIADLVAHGYSNKQAAAELFLSVSTVEATLTRVYTKLGLSSRTQLVRARAGKEPSLTA